MKKKSLLALVPVIAIIGVVGAMQLRQHPSNARIAQVQQPASQIAQESTEPVVAATETPTPTPPAPAPAPAPTSAPVETVDSVLAAQGWDNYMLNCIKDIRSLKPEFFQDVNAAKKISAALKIYVTPCAVLGKGGDQPYIDPLYWKNVEIKFNQ